MKPGMKVAIAVALVAIAVVLQFAGRPETPPYPTKINLTGLFVGGSAARDAAAISAISYEIADEIEWDGRQSPPKLATGAQFDALRTRAREFRCRGESIGARQPDVRNAVHQFLDKAVGVSGGPVSEEQRAAWVAAYREIGRAAENAIR